MNILSQGTSLSRLRRVSLWDCVISASQCSLLVSVLSPAGPLQELHLVTVFVHRQGESDGLEGVTSQHSLDALSGLAGLTIRIVLKREIFEGYFDSQLGLFLELFKKIDENPSRLVALDLDSQALGEIPSDLFSSVLTRMESINLTEASLTSDQVTALVSHKEYYLKKNKIVFTR